MGTLEKEHEKWNSMMVKLLKSDQCGPRKVQKTDFLPKIGKIGLRYILITTEPIKKTKKTFIRTLTWTGPITYLISSHFEVNVNEIEHLHQ